MAAIDIAIRNPIDLAIVDLQMPDMDGLVTITKLKEINPGLKTILLTTGVDDQNSTVQKGIQPDAIFDGLAELVQAWLSQLSSQP